MTVRRIWTGACITLAVALLAACGSAPVARILPEKPAEKSERKAAPVSLAPAVSEKQLMSAVDEVNSVFFPPDGVTVDAEGRRRLGEHVARLKADGDKVVTLVGHTDDLGSPSYNLAIAEQRVNAVYAVLRSQGVPATQIRRYGLGAEDGGPACKSAACRRLMRRVQLNYD